MTPTTEREGKRKTPASCQRYERQIEDLPSALLRVIRAPRQRSRGARGVPLHSRTTISPKGAFRRQRRKSATAPDGGASWGWAVPARDLAIPARWLQLAAGFVGAVSEIEEDVHE